MPEKIFGIRDIVPNNIRDNVPNTKNSYFQMLSTMSLIPKKKLSLIPNSVDSSIIELRFNCDIDELR